MQNDVGFTKAKLKKEKKFKPRDHAVSEPKSLTPAKAPPASLTDSVEDVKISTKILPPANPEHVRNLVTDSSSEDDGTTETSFTENLAGRSAVSGDLFDSSEGPSDDQPADGADNFDRQITKLAQMVQQQFSTSGDELDTPTKSPTKKIPGVVEHL